MTITRDQAKKLADQDDIQQRLLSSFVKTAALLMKEGRFVPFMIHFGLKASENTEQFFEFSLKEISEEDLEKEASEEDSEEFLEKDTDMLDLEDESE